MKVSVMDFERPSGLRVQDTRCRFQAAYLPCFHDKPVLFICKLFLIQKRFLGCYRYSTSSNGVLKETARFGQYIKLRPGTVYILRQFGRFANGVEFNGLVSCQALGFAVCFDGKEKNMQG